MSRSSKFISGIAASYIAVATQIAYSLAVVPIGVRYLGADQFGLWMLLVQVAGYLNLLELGVFGSAARILIDYKDRKGDSAYAEVVATASVILVGQGIFMMAACWFLAPWVVHIFHIPTSLQGLAVHLLVWLGFATGITTCFRIFGVILYANQRVDLIWTFSALNSLLSLVVIWPLLATGHGLEALPWSFFPPVILTIALSWFACHKLQLFPPSVGFAYLRIKRFYELFRLGADFFIVNVGTQLLEASQLMIVSRTMGLSAAAIWSVSTKIFTLLFQLIAKVENTAVVFFSEMMARGEQEKLKTSFRQMYQLTGGLAICAMFGAVAVNPYFVTAWAGPEMLWPGINNWLIAALLSFNLLLRCHTDLAMHTKKIGLLRVIFFLESIVFVLLSLWAAPRFGFAGVLSSSLLCALLFRSAYATLRTASYFKTPVYLVGFQWVSLLGVPALAMVLLATAVVPIVERLPSPATRFLGSAVIVAIVGSAVFFMAGVPASFRSIFFERTSQFFRWILGKLAS